MKTAMRKYEFTGETKTLCDGTVLHRIRALIDIVDKNPETDGLIIEINHIADDECGSWLAMHRMDMGQKIEQDSKKRE